MIDRLVSRIRNYLGLPERHRHFYKYKLKDGTAAINPSHVGLPFGDGTVMTGDPSCWNDTVSKQIRSCEVLSQITFQEPRTQEEVEELENIKHRNRRKSVNTRLPKPHRDSGAP